jgi:hypothetical protein
MRGSVSALKGSQQARLSEFGEEGLIDIVFDATGMQMRRMFDRLIAGERVGRRHPPAPATPGMGSRPRSSDDASAWS